MTEKTIKCASCFKDYTYEVPTKYPDTRKYCGVCSEAKKQLYQGVHEDTPKEEEVKPEVVKMSIPEVMEDIEKRKWGIKPKDNGFHLTPENINLGALRCAIEDLKGQTTTGDGFWNRVKTFKRYILTGE